MYFPREEYEVRWSRLQDEMGRRGYETAVVWQRTGGSYDRAGDVWYLTNYASHNIGQEPSAWGVGCALAALLVRKGEEPELHILAPEFSTVEEVDRSYVAVDHIRGHEENLATGLGARLNELQIEGPVAYVGDDFLPAQMYRMLLADTPSINWVAEDDLLFGLQSHKSARELDLYREAGEISSRALSAFIESLIRGERQSDAAAAAAKIIVAAGGGFQRIGCHAGPRGEHSFFDYPLYGYSREAPNPGEMVRAWVIPVFEGYWLDPGRTSVCELKPSPEQKRLIEDGARILEEITAAIKPGQTPRHLGTFGDRLLERYGYEPEAGNYGHGLATFWLGPVIPAGGAVPDQDDPLFGLDIPLHEGQIFTSEVFPRKPGIGFAGFEDVFIIREHGNERLIHTPLLFW